LMSSIYRKAHEVVGWLGEADDDSDYAIQVLTRMADEMRRDDQGQSRSFDDSDPFDGSHSSDDSDLRLAWLSRMPELTQREAGSARFATTRPWAAIAALLNRPFWTRIWILQETALAMQLRLLCGTMSIEWARLGFISDRLTFPKDFFYQASHLFHPGLWSVLPRKELTQLFPTQILRHAIRRGEQLDLAHAAVMTRSKKATEPRDHIYGLLGLVDSQVLVDYARPVEDLYLEVSTEWIREEPESAGTPQSALLYAGIRGKRPFPALASWAVDFSALGDILRRWDFQYKASGASILRAAALRADGGRLWLRGSVVDSITDMKCLEKSPDTDARGRLSRFLPWIALGLRETPELELGRLFRTIQQGSSRPARAWHE